MSSQPKNLGTTKGTASNLARAAPRSENIEAQGAGTIFSVAPHSRGFSPRRVAVSS